MVFESIVTDILNRFLGSYVENLNSSQLKLSIWSGDVHLKNLKLKESALNELNLPINVVSGSLSKLMLRIPWSNLYNAPVIVEIDGLHLLAVPNLNVRYDAKAEEAARREAKQKLIKSYEDSQKLSEKSAVKTEKDDTFVEKLTAQIIKNVQLSISNIHVRYEDDITDKECPLACGVTLHNISVKSTNDKWQETAAVVETRKIFKLVKLEGFAIYFNAASDLFYKRDRQSHHQLFDETIARPSSPLPADYRYLLGPIELESRLTIDPRPELDNFSAAKLSLCVDMRQLQLAISRRQYASLTGLLASFERLQLAAPYRKYRRHDSAPAPATSAAVQRWLFAYRCVLNEVVRRRRRNWSWVHMKAYMDMRRRYQQAYRTKLSAKKVPPETLPLLADCEYKLDLVSVIVIRKRVEAEVGSQSQLEKAEAATGWFGGWFGRGSAVQPQAAAPSVSNIGEQLQTALSADERAKLYSAIDYEDQGGAGSEYPAAYEAVQLTLSLASLQMSVLDDQSAEPARPPVPILCARLVNFCAVLRQRPACGGLLLQTDMSALSVRGAAAAAADWHRAPVIVATDTAGDEKLFTLALELNPECRVEERDGGGRTRLYINSRPLRIVYHAATVSQLASVFQPADAQRLAQLQAAAAARLVQLRHASSLRLQYAIEQHHRLQLDVTVMAPLLVVPERGDSADSGGSGGGGGGGRVLAVRLGQLTVVSAVCEAGRDRVTVSQMVRSGSTPDQIYERLSQQAYDRFRVCLADMEVAVATAGEAERVAGGGDRDWSALRLVEPISVSMEVGRCVVTDDPRLPLLTADLHLPLLQLCVSDYRLAQLAALLQSLPHATAAGGQQPLAVAATTEETPLLAPAAETADIVSIATVSQSPPASSDQLINLQLTFRLSEFSVRLFRREAVVAESAPAGLSELAHLSVQDLLVQLKNGASRTEAEATLHQILLDSVGATQQQQQQSDRVTLVSCGDGNSPVLSAHYRVLDPLWSRQHPEPDRIDQVVSVAVGDVSVVVHQQAVCALLATLSAVADQFAAPPSATSGATTHGTTSATTTVPQPVQQSTTIAVVSSATTRHTITEPPQTQLQATFKCLQLQLCTHQLQLSTMQLQQLTTTVTAGRQWRHLQVQLRSASVLDLSRRPDTVCLLSVTGDQLLAASVRLYDQPHRIQWAAEAQEVQEQPVDVDVQLRVGGARLVLLNRFFADLAVFAAPFAQQQAAVAAASHQAADAAQQALQTAYANAVRVRLDVLVQAPLLLVPQAAASRRVLLADLGLLRISNQISHAVPAGAEEAAAAAAVVDNIRLRLDNVQLSTALLEEPSLLSDQCSSSVSCRRPLLAPVSFTLDVRRRLTPAAAGGQLGDNSCPPEVSVSAKLERLSLILDSQAYVQLLATLSGNILEEPLLVADESPATATATVSTSADQSVICALDEVKSEPVQLSAADRAAPSVELAVAATAADTLNEQQQQQESEQSQVRFCFSFDWSFVGLELRRRRESSGTTGVVPGGTQGRADVTAAGDDGFCALGRFSMLGLRVSGQYFANGAVTCDIVLDNCVVEDLRPDVRTQFPRILHKMADAAMGSTGDETPPAPPLFCVKFSQKTDIDRTVDVRVSRISLIFFLPYFMAVASFFQTGDPVADDSIVSGRVAAGRTAARAASSRTARSNSLNVAVAGAASATSSATASGATSSATSHTRVSIYVEEPDVAVVENIDAVDTRAVIFQARVQVLAQLATAPAGGGGATETRLALDCRLQSVRLFACQYAPQLRAATTSEIVGSFNVETVGQWCSGGGTRLQVSVSPLGLHVNAAVINLLSSLSASLAEAAAAAAAGGGESEASEQPVAPVQPDFSALWQSAPIVPGQFDFIQCEVGEEAVEEVVVAAEAEAGRGDRGSARRHSVQLVEQLVLSLESVCVTVEQSVGDRQVPLVLLQSSVSATVRDWSTLLAVSGSVTLEMNYFNSRLSAWEPIVERVELPSGGERTQLVPLQFDVDVRRHDVCSSLPSTAGQSPSDSSTVSPSCSADEDLSAAAAGGGGPAVVPAAALTVRVSTRHTVQLVLSRTCLDTLVSLHESMSEAAAAALPSSSPVRSGGRAGGDKRQVAQLVVRNCLSDMLVLNTSGVFTCRDQPVDEVFVNADAQVELLTCGATTLPSLASAAGQQSAGVAASEPSSLATPGAFSSSINVSVPSLEFSADVPLWRAEPRYYRLRGATPHASQSQLGLVCDVSATHDCKLLTVRSALEVENHLPVRLSVYYRVDDRQLECDGVVAAGQRMALSLAAVAAPGGELFFMPSGCAISTRCYSWRPLLSAMSHSLRLQCPPRSAAAAAGAAAAGGAGGGGGSADTVLLCDGQAVPILFGGSQVHTIVSRSLRVHVRPVVVLHNLMPLSLACHSGASGSGSGGQQHKQLQLAAGDSCQLPWAAPGCRLVLWLLDYRGTDWRADLSALPDHSEPLSALVFVATGGARLSAGLHTRLLSGTLHASVYAPFWMINRTGLPLSYLASGESDASGGRVTHPPDHAGPFLFSYGARSMFGKQKVSVAVADAAWSARFSLDTAGSAGLVTCSSPDGREMALSVAIELSRSGLTRHVVFSPSLVAVNNSSDFAVQLCEMDSGGGSGGGDWVTVEPGACRPLWPRHSRAQFVCRVAGSGETSVPFSVRNTGRSLLQLANSYGAVEADVRVSEAGTVLALSGYYEGAAALRVVNCLPAGAVVRCSQQGAAAAAAGAGEAECVVAAGESCLFAWRRPDAERTLLWSCHTAVNRVAALHSDAFVQFAGPGGALCYCVIFLHIRQRTMLFTDDWCMVLRAQNPVELERIDTQLVLDIAGIGFSLVDNIGRRDILYMGVTGSGVVWETRRTERKRFRALEPPVSEALEAAYSSHCRQLAAAGPARLSPAPLVTLNNGMQVDFERQLLVAPQQRQLRRTCRAGLWLCLGTSDRQRQLHIRLQRLQLDNQQLDCVFPVVMAPVAAARSVVAETVARPFIEATVVERLAHHSPIAQFKYARVLVQEFHVRLDIAFIYRLAEFFSGGGDDSGATAAAALSKTDMDRDLASAGQPLLTRVTVCRDQSERLFFDDLHFSPLKVHVSFSMNCGDSTLSDSGPLAVGFIDLLLRSIGVTVTEVEDVVFRLAYFERRYTFFGPSDLVSQVRSHYTGQALKQLYVLVLGLDVIGNPFGLVVGLKDGVSDLFYEPVQGAIQGPGEFVEGLAIGVRSLVSHAVGGTAGAVSRIAGTLGKGVAALTMDEEYRRQRREQMSSQPADLGAGLAQSSRRLVMGVYDGVTGVVRKPLEGAQQGGALGFFKGVGLGVTGLLARPASGAIDFASGSLNAVRRSLDGESGGRLRPLRHFHADGVLRPYVRHEAEGAQILLQLDKGRYASTDHYVAHCQCSPGHRQVLLVTDRRLLLMHLKSLLGSWQLEWTCMLQQLDGPPALNDSGLQIPLPPAGSGRFSGLFGRDSALKQIVIASAATAQWILGKIEVAIDQLDV